MTTKRFTSKYINEEHISANIYDNNTFIGSVSIGEELIVYLLNELHEENYKIKSLLLKKVEELNDAYNKSAKAGMPTGGIIGELDSFEEICRVMGWLE